MAKAVDEAATKVRELIFGGSLEIGDRLPAERELCVMLGVSRPALREALRAFEAGGFLEIRAGKYGGAFITGGRSSVASGAMSDLLELGHIPIGELFEARQWIQVPMVRVACERFTSEQIDALDENVTLAEQAHLSGDTEGRMRLNVDFHTLLAQGTGNAVATIVVRGLNEGWQALMRRVGSDMVPGSMSYRRELIKSLRERDAEGAAKAMMKILSSSEALYKKLARQRQEQLQPRSANEAPAVKQPAAKKSSALRAKQQL